MTDSVAPDQMLQNAAFDLGLDCFCSGSSVPVFGLNMMSDYSGVEIMSEYLMICSKMLTKWQTMETLISLI